MAKVKEAFVPSAEEKREVFRNSLWYEVVFTFGVPAHDPTDYCQWEMFNFSRMGHARVLYGFLETKTSDRFRDDVLAEDYGFMAEPIDLSPEDRLRLNKDLFHLTYSRLRHTPASKLWPDSILSSVLEPCLRFMEHVKTQEELFPSEGELTNWIRLMELLKTGRELQVYCSLAQGNRPEYTLNLGPELPGGKPILTRLQPR